MRLRNRVLAAALSAAMVVTLMPTNLNTVSAAVETAATADDAKYANSEKIGTSDGYDYYVLYNQNTTDTDPEKGVDYKVVTVTAGNAVGDDSQAEAPTYDYDAEWSSSTGENITNNRVLTYDAVASANAVSDLKVPTGNQTYKLKLSLSGESSKNCTVSINVGWKAVATITEGAKNVFAIDTKWFDLTAPTVVPADGYSVYYRWDYYDSEDGVWVNKTSYSRYNDEYDDGYLDDELTATYRCVVKIVNDDDEVVQLYVSDGYKVTYLDEAPFTMSVVSTKKAYIGEAISVSAGVTKNGNYDISYKWEKYQNGGYQEVSKDETFKLAAVTAADYGKYRVTVTACEAGTQNVVYTKSRVFDLEEKGPYTVKQNDGWGSANENSNGTYIYSTYLSKTLGENLSLKVNIKPADGWNVTYEWYKNSIKLDGMTTNEYAKDALGSGDFATYVCKVKAVKADNSATYEKDSFRFVVSEETGLTKIKSSDTLGDNDVPEGVAFALKASEYETGSNYTISYKWEKYDTAADEYVELTGQTAQSLAFAAVAAGDYGKYRCTITASRADNTAMESAWNRTTTEEFEMINSPKLKVERKSDAYAEKKIGEQINLAVKAEVGSDKYDVTYAWTLNGKELADAKAASLTKNLTKDDFGTYTCTVTAVSKADSSVSQSSRISYTVEEDTGFEVKTPSENVIYGKNVGDQVTLSVDAKTTDAYALTYKWTKEETYEYSDVYGEVVTVEGAVTKDLALTLTEKDFAIYTCEVSNGKQSKVITFTIVKNDGFYAIPSGQTKFYKKDGESVTFTVRAGVDTDAKLTYQWYKDGKINGQTKETYTVASLKDGLYGEYCCVVTNETTKQSKYVSFAVSDVTKLYIYRKGEEDNYLNVGEGVSFGVGAKNTENVNLLYKWYFKAADNNDDDEYYYDDEDDEDYNLSQFRVLDDTTAELNIAAVAKEQFGTYVLRVYKDNYENDSLEREYSFYVYEYSKAFYAHAKNYYSTYEREPGSSVTFNVEAASKNGEALTYQWYHEADAIYGETGNSMTLAAVTPANYGIYKCVVTCGEGDDKVTKRVYFYLNRTGALNIEWDCYDGEDSDDYGTKYVKANIGQKADFAVTATSDANYPLAYQWFKYDKDLENYLPIHNATEAAYSIASVTKDDYTSYVCEVTNGAATERLTFCLTADDGLQSSRNYTVTKAIAKGGTATFKSAASCAKGFTMTYQWYGYDVAKNKYVKIDGATTASYTTPAINFAYYDTVSYKCEVKTEASEMSEYFEVVEKGTLNLEVTGAKDGAAEGTKVKYTAKITNPDKLDFTYQWYAENENGTYDKVAGATKKTYTATMPTIEGAYTYRSYLCIATSGTEENKKELTSSVSTLIVDKPAKMNKLPSSKTSANTNVKGYKVKNAATLQVTFDSKMELADGTSLTIVDGAGEVFRFTGSQLAKTTLKLKGPAAYFLLNVYDPDTTVDMTKTGYKVKAIKATIKKTVKKVSLGMKEKYSIKVKGGKYTTNKKKVVAVSKKGIATAKKLGKATVTVKSSSKSITYKFTVKKAPKKIAKVTPKKVNLKVKKSVKLKVKLPKGTASGKITYKSSNKKVAAVNANGKVTAKKKGNAKITIKTFNGKKKVVKVKVKK